MNLLPSAFKCILLKEHNLSLYQGDTLRRIYEDFY